MECISANSMENAMHATHTITLAALRRLVLGTSALAAISAGAAFAQAPPSSGHDVSGSLDAAAITRRHTTIDNSGVYQREIRACLSGRSHQARETCLEEAHNAHDAALRGQLAMAGEDFTANVLGRCEPLAGEDRAACEARVLGFGGSSGSVAGGGLLRWVETVVLPQGQAQVRILPQTREPVLVIGEPR
jgi:hypothetical protein